MTGEYRLSRHARSRAAEMGLPTVDVIRTVTDPEHSYPSQKYPGQVVYRRAPIAVAVDPARRVIITVLWDHSATGYVQFDRKTMPPPVAPSD